MGPNFWRHPANGLKKCSEKTRTSCTDHDDCCAVTACTYCLELEVYGDPVQHGVADQVANHWTGTVGGYAFDMYWERNYETGVCELVVIFDGDEVYRKTCAEGQSCRDSTDSAEVIVGYPPESATLRWIKHEPLQLPHIDDPDTGCKTLFCGECECSCECLCVEVVRFSYLVPDIIKGEICTAGYPCESPIWEGSVGGYDLSLRLDRDAYGDCIIVPTVDGYQLEPVAVTGCKDLTATIILEDETIISVRCKKCDCDVSTLCCPDRCNTSAGETCDNPLPATVTCELTVSTVKSDPITGAPTACFSVSGTLYLSPIDQYIGLVEGTCSGWCGETERIFQYTCKLACGVNPDGSTTWWIAVLDNAAGNPARVCTAPTGSVGGEGTVWAELSGSCDPILLTGQTNAFLCGSLTCIIPIMDIDENFGDVIFDVLVTEDP